MLEKHPELKFMGAHLASLEWSVDEVAKFFDRFPNATVDLSARMCHLQLQAQENRGKVRNFIIKYQNRIIYGVDMVITRETNENPGELTKNAHEAWFNDWLFLATDKTLEVGEVDGVFKGLKLPRKVLEKIYRENAEKMFPGI